MARIEWTAEEKAAVKVVDAIIDPRLDQEQIGRYLARQPQIAVIEAIQATTRGFLEENDPYIKPVNFNEAYEAEQQGRVVEQTFHPVTKAPLWDSSVENQEPVETTAEPANSYGTDFLTRCKIISELYLSEDKPESASFYKENRMAFGLAYLFESGSLEYTFKIENKVNELWAKLLYVYGHANDTGFYEMEDFTEGYDEDGVELVEVNEWHKAKASLIMEYVNNNEEHEGHESYVTYFDLAIPMAEAIVEEVIPEVNEDMFEPAWVALLSLLNLGLYSSLEAVASKIKELK